MVRRDLPMLPPFAELIGWSPFREAAPFEEAERELLAFDPDFDMKETEEAYVFKADLPGIDEKDIDISVAGDRLTVTGKREEEKKEKGERYYTWERSSGEFVRSFALPKGIDPDHVEAELKAGVLTITAPKKPELKPHKVAVKA